MEENKTNRRTFMKARAAAAAVAATGLPMPSSRAQGKKPMDVHPDPKIAAWEASEKAKWDALNAHMTPQFDACYDFYHSGLDCADADVWREDDPVKEVPKGPPPIPSV